MAEIGEGEKSNPLEENYLRPATFAGAHFPMSHSTNASAIDGVVSIWSSIRQSYLFFRTIAPDVFLDVTHFQRSFV